MQSSWRFTSGDLIKVSVLTVIFSLSLVVILLQLSLANPHGLSIVGMSITALASLAGNIELLRRIRAKSDEDGDYGY